MQPKDAAEDEPPSLLWGLDPVFSAYARIYVKDILQMRESRQVPGVYFYKSHPLFQVDVLGTVVYRRERDDFYCYGVDDGTGVISCLCWKDEKWQDHGDSVKAATRGPAGGGFNVEEQLKKLQEAQRSSTMLDIGDLLRVRGCLKTSREQREILASSFYKVNDPVMSVQISWMLEMPQLYRDCYDKPFHIPSSELSASANDNLSGFQSVLCQSVHILKEFLKEKEVTRFRPYDVEYLLHPLIQQPAPSTSAEQELKTVQSMIPAQIRKLLKETLKILQEEGEIFRKVMSQDEVYNVTEHDKDLLAAICHIIREDCKREKYAEKGCHVLHILSSVRQRYSHNLSRKALDVALKFLECNSDIISTADAHYTAL
ncbi:CST complex subunit STN1 isoform X2 [Tachysurus vachellii]|uniref:CST complex subunit STN1 isoform X2 n=1 Tax=Tachysurus vachellii TaxID=175792 RepID=UPI00296A904C|nr:CST complex subunit STN1 isoform X2 [Tachysurus vachellii]